MTRARKNPLRTDPITEFFRIIRDPSPGSMEVAQDLLEENHLTLTQVSEAGEVFIPPNLSNEIAISKMSGAEWLDHVSNSAARGYFDVTPEGLLDNVAKVGVAWAIQQRSERIPLLDGSSVDHAVYIGALYIVWGRETWIETDNGISRFNADAELSAGRRRTFTRDADPWFFESFVAFPKPDTFVTNLRPRLVKAAWRIAKVLHRYAEASDDLSDVRAKDIMLAIRQDFLERGLVADKSIPREIVPMDDGGNGRRRVNPGEMHQPEQSKHDQTHIESHRIGVPCPLCGERPPPRTAKKNPGGTRTWSDDEIVDEFRKLIADPDPAVMQIAADLLEEHGKTLVWVSSQIWKEEEIWSAGIGRSGNGSHVAVETFGTKIYKAGFFPLYRDNQAWLSLGWTVLSTHNPTTSRTIFTPQLQLCFHDVEWIETNTGPSMPMYNTRRMADRTTIDELAGDPILPIVQHTPGPDSSIVPELVRVAWAVARTLKRLSASQRKEVSKVDMEGVLDAVHRYQQSDLPADAIVFGRTTGPGDMKPNPPWVTHALADAFESLSSQVPPEYLPKLDDVHGGPKGTLVAQLKEYGCGVYGCVLPTLSSNVVLKVTTDDTEAEFASQLAAELVAPICVEYYMAVSLAARHKGRPIYLLWRESADDVGTADKILGKKADEAIHKQHKAAQAAYIALSHGHDATALLHEWQAACQDMAFAHPELETLANGMVEVFRRQKILLSDVHAGNIGRVFRGGAKGEWVITDPGNVAVVA